MMEEGWNKLKSFRIGLSRLAMASKQVADISVIICAYTEERWGEMNAAINSLQNQTVLPKEILLVIDHNPRLYDRTVREVDAIAILQNQYAVGLSGARNTGIVHSSGALLAFMDEDAVAEQDWIEQILLRYQTFSVLGVGGAIIPNWKGGRPGWFPEEFDWVVGCTYRGLPDKVAPVRNLIGCNMSFRREVFEHVGGFRTGMGRIGTLPVGCEETELCIRASQRLPEGVFLFVPTAKVRHEVPSRRSSWRYFLSRCYSEGRSKALVAHFSGASQGLASEKAYTLRVLPAGVTRGIKNFITRGDISGLGRAAAIMLGLAFTTTGYVVEAALGAKPNPEGGQPESLVNLMIRQPASTNDHGKE